MSGIPKTKWADLSADDQQRARTLYEQGVPPAELARALGLTNIDIGRQARAGSWERPLASPLEDIRRDYEAGVLSYAEVARKHSVDNSRLGGLARKHGWTRRLEKRIRAEAEKRLQEEVAQALEQQRDAVLDEAIVEANASMQATITKHHRTGATGARETVLKLLAEMGALAIPQKELMRFAEVAALLRSQEQEDFDAQDQAYRDAIDTFTRLVGLNTRSTTAKNLVEALGKVVDLERRVYGIREEAVENDAVKALKELASGG